MIFQGLKTRLEEDKLELQINTYDNTCTVENKNTEEVDLKKLGVLLGFPENHKVAGNATELSPKTRGRESWVKILNRYV